MITIINKIIQQELKENVQSITKIVGLGAVNQVYDVKGESNDYIVRLNNAQEKNIEYLKEQWCTDKVGALGIPSPKVLSIGIYGEYCFMIQDKISGINGIKCTAKEKDTIWFTLGEYAATFQSINNIDQKEVEDNEFHKNWKSRLVYNLHELNEQDRLLKEKALTKEEHQQVKEALITLQSKAFNVGLVHGDLCPRNVIYNDGKIYLLDWGTAEVNVIPHTEIGLFLIREDVFDEEFKLFLQGFGMSTAAYKAIEKEVLTLNLLHRLDKYRWAESYDLEQIQDYADNIKKTFNTLQSTI